jgi:tetratricopeptide (TPR) repeat protein
LKPSQNISQPGLSPARRRVFLTITLLTPLLILLLLELFLRLIGYGPDLSLFASETIRGKNYLSMNPRVKGRYFYQVDFNPSTSPDRFQVPKPEGTFRIFCLGASTTVGYPYWFNGSFATFLRDRLRATFPHKSIEVINLGMTATNSYAVADIARELPAYQPDCIIVYDGHNEFYGALGIASHESLGRSRWVNRLYLRVVHYRTYTLMRDLVSAVSTLFRKREEALPPATMMERLSRGQYVPYDSELYRDGLVVFRENLGELRDICKAAGVPLILSTQVSNLRRQSPFVSASGPQKPAAEQVMFNLAFNNGMTDYLNGEFANALAAFRGITGSDTLRADIHFHVAQCLDTLSRPHEAAPEYTRARDLDQLRFRASSDFNEAIRAMEDGATLFVADIEKVFAASSPDSLTGSEFITEHLHPNLTGHFMIARVYAGLLRSHGLVMQDTSAWRAADTLSETRLWNERNATTIDEMIGARKTAILTSGWPFRDQPPAVPSVPENDTLGQIVELYTRDRISWERAHLDAAAYYGRHRTYNDAVREYQVVAAEVPFDATPLVMLGELLVRAGRTGEAREAFQRSLQREETARGYSGLGGIALLDGALAEATRDYEKAIQVARSPEERGESRYVLALLYLRSGDRGRAMQELKEVLKESPSNRQAAELLSRIGGH